MSLLITGGTGFLGMSLIARLLEEDGPEIAVLVRDEARLDQMLATLYETPPPATRRLRPVVADLLEPLPGLDLRDVTHVVHCAAAISFTLPLDQARAINVEGTRRVLALAASLPHLERVVHVSTAYVAGRRATRFDEDDVAPGAFRNTYEQTKSEAEALVRAARLPVTIVRPSIVVGESTTGWTPAFNVLYWPLQAFARGLVPELPADPEGIVDVVPVDHVVDVLLAALEHPGVLHAVAGDDALSVAELLVLGAAALEREPPPIVAPRADHPAGVFAPYFDVACRFGDARTRALGLPAPPVEAYFGEVVAYAQRARWGKRPLTREAARMTPGLMRCA